MPIAPFPFLFGTVKDGDESPRQATPRAVRFFFATSLFILIAFEVMRVYWIMPFPGSQQGGTLEMAYALHQIRWGVRLVAGALVAWYGWLLLRDGKWLARTLTVLGMVLYGVIAWQTNGPMSADVMFLEPAEPLAFATPGETTLPQTALVVGVVLGDPPQARAYPIRQIGYHHQVRDTVGGQPIMVTYCTVCRTGRVLSPVVDGEADRFRLVGMDHFNAMFEDDRTGSWWRQATGEAVAGPRKGAMLAEVPSRQMTWEAWVAQHPETTVLQPDARFTDVFARMQNYEDGSSKSSLTGRDPGSWQEKSWVVGIVAGGAARAFDWNELVQNGTIVDQVGGVPVLLHLGADGATFYAYDATPLGATADFIHIEATKNPREFRELTTGTVWSEDGIAVAGPLAGTRLKLLPAYQEFWHSWRTFHPETSVRR
jgi:hypothetical protein